MRVHAGEAGRYGHVFLRPVFVVPQAARTYMDRMQEVMVYSPVVT